jgi:hypothetical protein
MTTNIVVDVALSALRQLNQAQVNANRQAKLLADRNSGMADAAVAEDAKAKAQQGQSRGGGLLYGVKADRLRRQQEAAAVYRTVDVTPYWLLAPSDSGFTALTRGIDPFPFVQPAPSIFNNYYNLLLYAIGEGPDGANAFYPSQAFLGADPGYSYYAATARANSTIRSEPAGRAFTFELMAKFSPEISNQVTLPFAYVYANIARWNIGIQVDQSQVGGGVDPYAPFNSVTFFHGSRSYTVWNASNSDVGVGDVVAASALDSSIWHHLALVQRPGSGNASRTVSCYVNGTRYFHLVDLPNDGDAPIWDNGPSDDLSLETAYGNGVTGLDPIAYNPLYAHGVRFTPRALYSGASFTPPTTITALS